MAEVIIELGSMLTARILFKYKQSIAKFKHGNGKDTLNLSMQPTSQLFDYLNMPGNLSRVVWATGWQPPPISALNFDASNETLCKAAGAWKAESLSVFQDGRMFITTNFVLPPTEFQSRARPWKNSAYSLWKTVSKMSAETWNGSAIPMSQVEG
ncbi:hypothetical protein F4818DRAFT_439752 [Hypoxylon cercidicola]|nr:hypothetical protein F4818DRAFT_439752 [Hypoxylon cercidicola]